MTNYIIFFNRPPIFTPSSVRGVTRAGLATTALAAFALLATMKPDLAELSFAIAMGLLGVGMGLIASQLGLVVQSSVDASGRGEAGGLQYTGQHLDEGGLSGTTSTQQN